MVLPLLSDSSAASSRDFLFDEVGQLEEELAAVGGVHLAPRAGFEGAAGGLDRLVHVGGRGGGHLDDDLAVSGVDRVEVLAFGRLDPFVVDEEAGLLDGRGGGAFQRGLRHGGKPSW